MLNAGKSILARDDMERTLRLFECDHYDRRLQNILNIIHTESFDTTARKVVFTARQIVHCMGLLRH